MTLLFSFSVSSRNMNVVWTKLWQCYDGAVVMASGLNGVQAKVKEKAPMALFIHCYAHRLNFSTDSRGLKA